MIVACTTQGTEITNTYKIVIDRVQGLDHSVKRDGDERMVLYVAESLLGNDLETNNETTFVLRQ
jgi:hypothetical protein